MRLVEFFVTYIQAWLPNWLLLRILEVIFWLVGLKSRWQYDRTIRSIAIDRTERAAKPVTTDVDVTNMQLYGNDPEFFESHLGPRLKYSACVWPADDTRPVQDALADAESFTIAIYQEKAGLPSLPAGSRVLELGCGWGSLTLANATRFPKLEFVAFSNSPQQIEYIRAQAKKRSLNNLKVHVEDYANFVQRDTSKLGPDVAAFDAAIAIETIEHAQNIRKLLSAVADRLRPGAKLFVQSLLHQNKSYVMSDDDWMGRNFFTGGSILSLNSYFHLAPPSLYIAAMEPVNGTGYSKTLLAWLYKMEPNRAKFVSKYGVEFYEGFRLFYALCAKAFAANHGALYMCGYYTFVKR